MGYIYRKTSGFINCHPKAYQFKMYPKPNTSCNARCPYHIFCDLEINHMTIAERIKEIKLVLQRPFHNFTFLGEEEGFMLILEGMDNEKNPRLSFRGKSIVGAVETTEQYIKKERAVGSMMLKKEETKIETKKEDNTPPKK